MFKATLAKEVTVETENTKGIAAKVSGLIAHKAGAKIQAGFAMGVNGSGRFSFLTDNNDKVLDALKSEFPKSSEIDVLVIETNDSVGEVAEVTDKLSHAGLNIHFIYTTYINNKPVIIVSTDNDEKGLELFN